MLGKRRRSLQLDPQQRESLRQVVTEQIDLEIALKRRLAAAARARLEWAQLVKSSIDGLTSDATRGYPANAFRDAALAAYENIEAPCEVISSTSIFHLSAWPNGKPQMVPAIMVPEAPRTRKRVTLGLTQGSSAGPILFEERSTGRPVTLKLVCTDCSRSDFPTMQGFLNHCRLAHSRVYGTHDECIQATGVVVDGDEREALLASGVEINTINIPSLKGMFERAVGLAPTTLPSLSEPRDKADSIGNSSKISTHLSKTLGYHKDTRTLAPFLGKQAKRKCIHVYDDSGSIDITAHDDSKPFHTSFLKKRARHDTDSGWSINLAALTAERTGDIDIPEDLPTDSLDSVTRFHVTRRILVSDRSLYLPESRRPAIAMSHTHRWQLSISSPSYGQHITTFLSRLTVNCVTQPAVFTPILVSRPPFTACSTTDRPFLARLILEWVGEQNHAFEVDHWVELDQLKAARPVLGDEQMVDVELDRNTIFLPVQDTVNTVPWNGDGDCTRNDVVGSHISSLQHGSLAVRESTSSSSEPEYIRLLRSIVPRFPMTTQDLGTRQTPTLPYILYPSRVKLLSLVPGRRKAIEWSRALAIRTEYDILHTSSGSEDLINLTTADVYRWLDAEGKFPRPRIRTAKPPPQNLAAQPTITPSQPLTVPPRFCSVCGVSVYGHTPGVRVIPEKQTVTQIIGYQCSPEMERRRAPIIHVYTLLAPSRTPLRSAPSGHISLTSNPRDFVTVARPQLTQLVRQEVASLSLCSGVIPEAERDAGLMIDHEIPTGRNRREVDENLASHALLAITLEQVVKDLVRGGLQVAREMQSLTKASTLGTREDMPTALLTPTHVLQGLLIKEADLGGPKEALFKCFSRVGTLLALGTSTHSSAGLQQGVYGTQRAG
ncbi:hypothetical protein JB92DRAFT_1188905 [Gautieria morchelliformis]|nr:hypothetical protein JB92DRAFT_1188905 [Gautieria morchelliformis]